MPVDTKSFLYLLKEGLQSSPVSIDIFDKEGPAGPVVRPEHPEVHTAMHALVQAVVMAVAPGSIAVKFVVQEILDKCGDELIELVQKHLDEKKPKGDKNA